MSEAISKNKVIAKADDKAGEMNQEATVVPNFFQLIVEAFNPDRPAPIKAPITVCVQLIGIPKIDENMIKKTDEIKTANIMRSWI